MAANASTADFRSDTLTKPDAVMREAMAGADVGDDVWGEDPTVAELEEAACAALDLEAAVFMPSGTMANQVAIHVHCRPGDEVLCEGRSHVYQYEGGSIARLSGASVRLLPSEAGHPDVATLESGLRPDDQHFPTTRLLVLENTHNMAGGRVLPPDGVAERVDWAVAKGLRVHVDGARLFNAAVACGCAASSLVVGADSVSICLSKGLGAPVGSVLAGSQEFIRQARGARKAFGGGMRQAGILAAAGLLALRDGPGRLARDHECARALGEALEQLPGLALGGPVETNILMVDLDEPLEAASFVAALAEDGVLCAAVGPQRIRFVTHRDLPEDAVQRAAAAVARACNSTRTVDPATSPDDKQ